MPDSHAEAAYGKNMRRFSFADFPCPNTHTGLRIHVFSNLLTGPIKYDILNEFDSKEAADAAWQGEKPRKPFVIPPVAELP